MSGLVGKAYPICVMLNKKSSALSAEDFLLFCSVEAWQCVLENLDACLGLVSPLNVFKARIEASKDLDVITVGAYRGVLRYYQDWLR